MRTFGNYGQKSGKRIYSKMVKVGLNLVKIKKLAKIVKLKATLSRILP